MNRGLGVDVLKSHNRAVLIDDLSFDLPTDDTAKKTISHLSFLLSLTIRSANFQLDNGSIYCSVSLRTEGKDSPLVYLYRDTLQKLPQARTPDTLPCRWLIRSSMVGTDDVPPILRKELVIHPVHGQRNMATEIDISKNILLVADQKAFNGSPLTTQPEFLRRPMRKLIRSADHFAFTRFLHGASSISKFCQLRKIHLRTTNQDISLIHQDWESI